MSGTIVRLEKGKRRRRTTKRSTIKDKGVDLLVVIFFFFPHNASRRSFQKNNLSFPPLVWVICLTCPSDQITEPRVGPHHGLHPLAQFSLISSLLLLTSSPKG